MWPLTRPPFDANPGGSLLQEYQHANCPDLPEGVGAFSVEPCCWLDVGSRLCDHHRSPSPDKLPWKQRRVFCMMGWMQPDAIRSTAFMAYASRKPNFANASHTAA